MSHELSIVNGKAEMAYVGEIPWHGLGNELHRGASIEEWVESANMGWKVGKSPVQFIDANGTLQSMADKSVLYREDTNVALSTVGSSFKVVQPTEVLEFFRDLVGNNGFELSTAGVLFGGKKFWAMADLGKELILANGDTVKGNLLLTTSVDGTSSTIGKFVSERVVCQNTLRVALNESGKNVVKQTHHKEFDPTSFKIDLGIIDAGWERFIQNIRQLSEQKVTQNEAKVFFERLVAVPDVAMEDQKWGVTRKVAELVNLYNNGMGAELSRGTKWGVLNAVTQAYTHGSGKRDPSHQFQYSTFGIGDSIKSEMYDMLMAS